MFPLAWRLAEVALEVWGCGDAGVETEDRRDGVDRPVMDDLKCAPEARICSPCERGETSISQSSESVIRATRRWQSI